jgi:hypothetical protein
LLRGDADVCRSLAYYAELRAALALLATAGIGVFDRDHFVVDGSKKVSRLPCTFGTHVATWLILKQWAQTPDAVTILSETIRPAGEALGDWIKASPIGLAWQPIGSNWLMQLGLDIELLARDREARNEASYRPTRLESRDMAEARVASLFVRELWRVFEPTPIAPFTILDQHLLRTSLETAFRAAVGGSIRSGLNASKFEEMVRAAVRSNVRSPHLERGYAEFLLRQAEPDDSLLIRYSRCDKSPRHPMHHLHVLSRAALLLRIATGASRKLLADAGIALGQLGFWWGELGLTHALWEDELPPHQFVDLWADVSDALDRVEAWEQGSGKHTYFSLSRDCAGALGSLSTGEAVALWGLA